LINSKQCFEKGLLIKTNPDKGLAMKSLEQAEYFLNKTNDLIEKGEKEIAILPLYSSFFHAARTLLFYDGVKEKSHYCIARYLEDNYLKKNLLGHEHITALDDIRNTRHEIQYALTKIKLPENLEQMVNDCETLITKIEEIIEKKEEKKQNY